MDSDSHSEDGSVEEIDETVTTETNCGNAIGPRSARNNPFLVNDHEEDKDSDDAIGSEDEVSKPDNEPPSSDSAFVDSMCQSEIDSIDLKVGGDPLISSSMMTSGVEVLDSSDIEIIREDRGSADSIEILESSVSMTTSSDRRTDSRAAHEHGDETLLDSSVIDSPTMLECSTSNGVEHSSPPEADNGLPMQDAGDTTTLKSGSSNDVESRGDTPVSNTSDSSHSGALPNVGYSKLQESNPSSYSPSPYDSPTHVTALVSVQSQQPAPSCDTSAEHARPESLSLPRSLQLCDRQRLAKKESYSSLSEYSSRSGSMDMLIEAVTSTPLHAQGTVSVEGEMTTFIAHGFNELIKKGKENPAAIWVNEVAPRSRSSSSISSTTSGWSASVASRATRSPSSVYTQSPDDIPPIDPKALFDVEMHARKVAENLDTLMLGLVGKLHKMSATTLSSLDVYKEAVDKTCDSVDANIKSMYALMAKCEELNRTMRPVYRIQDQIKEIKRLLDLFEAQVSDDEP